ncbi:MAG: Sodium-dependent dicarboxylate transporter SdcS [Phycisphaerae bacterium]|nr:Sodium-dependent dicarboxylate transporter SdcS [Phycisphaerae bacterium]
MSEQTTTRRRPKVARIIRWAVFLSGLLPAAALAVCPTVLGLDRAGQNALAVFCLCLGLWVSNLIPLAATGLLAIGLLPALGVMDAPQAFSKFGNSAVLFILGVFILAAAMIQTGLSKRMTLWLLERFEGSPRRLIAGVMASAAFLALWMPEHAVAAMMFPVVLGIAEGLELRRGSPLARKLFLAMAWGSVIGGVGTLLGGARAPLALELFRESYAGTPAYVPVTFLDWMIKALPVVLLLLGAGLLILTRGRLDVTDVTRARTLLARQVSGLGPMSGRERRLAAIGLLTVAAWILLGGHDGGRWGIRLDLAGISILSAVAVFALRVVTWNDIQHYVNWGVVVMYGGAVALGRAVQETGALATVAHAAIPSGMPPAALLVLMAVVTIALTETVSNTAAVAILLPAGFGMCSVTGISPHAMVYIVAIPAGLAFTLPMSSPPNAIAYSGGYYGMRDVLRPGLLMMAIALAAFLLVALLWWPIVGLSLW